MIKQDTLVVTPTLGNRNSTLLRTIESVKKIGGKRVKHVIVGPKSKEDEIKKFTNISYLSEPEDCKGIYQAVNHGLKSLADDYEYLTYINDDDYWMDGFHGLFEKLQNDPSLDVVYGKTLIVDENNEPIKTPGTTKFYKSFKTLYQNSIPLFTQQSTLMKSKVFIDAGGFDEHFKLVSDSFFWMSLIENNKKFGFVNKICAGYTFQDDRLSCNTKLQKEEQKKILKYFKKSNYFKSKFEVLRFRVLNLKNYINRK